MIFEGFCILKISGTEGLFEGITYQTRTFSRIFISEYVLVSSNFVSEVIFSVLMCFFIFKFM